MTKWQAMRCQNGRGFFNLDAKMAGCQNGGGALPLTKPYFPQCTTKAILVRPQSINAACNPIETIVSYIRCTNTIFAENGDAMNKDEPIEVETRVKVIAGCVLPEPELLAPTPPIEQALASIEENIIKDE